MKARRFIRDLGYVIRRQWWVARGERQRVIEERDRYKDWGQEQFDRARAADHTLWALGVDSLPASVDTLRTVAEEIDCGQDCEFLSPMDWSTGVRECPRSDGGDCPSDKACELRDLAAALETYSARAAASPKSGEAE